MNTMLMATHERVREFGLIKALGGTPGGIVRNVAAQALLLAMVVGVALGLAGSFYPAMVRDRHESVGGHLLDRRLGVSHQRVHQLAHDDAKER